MTRVFEVPDAVGLFCERNQRKRDQQEPLPTPPPHPQRVNRLFFDDLSLFGCLVVPVIVFFSF